MADSKGVIMSTLSTTGFIFAVCIVLASIFVERWKQLAMFCLAWFLLTEKRYRFLYMVASTFKRDVRIIFKFLTTIIQFLYWQLMGCTTEDMFLANVRRHPNKIAFWWEDEAWTFQELEDYSNRVANYLKSQGVVKGDHVGLLMENRPEVVGLWLGVMKLGGVTALINNNQRSSVLSHSIRTGNCKMIICSTEFVGALEEVLGEWPDLKVYVFGPRSEEALPNSTDLRQALSTSPCTPLREKCKSSMNDSFLLIYTSGTTGLPKAALVNHTRFYMMARGSFNMMWMRNDDVVYNTLPLYHSAGGLLGAGQCVLNGLTVVIRSKFSVSNFWSDCIKYDCTVAQYIGEMCRFLLAGPERPEEKAHKVRMVIGNGMRPQIWRAFVDRFNIQEVGEFYGATEGNCSMINTENEVGAVGFLPWFATLFNPYFLIKADPETNEPIRGEDGFCIKCKDDEPGILIGGVRKSLFNQFTGYADKKSTEKKVLRDVFKRGDVYFNSGDILARDEFGYFYFRDRTGDTFRWRGENVATSEVEAVISNVLRLKDAIVYGVEIPNIEGKAGMVAVVDLDNSLKLPELAEGVRKSLPVYARPLFLRVLHSIPITGTFKLQKVDLQKEGYDPAVVNDPLYFFNGSSFVPLTKELHENIVSGKMKL